MASVTPGQAAVVFDGDDVQVGRRIEDAVSDA
jgi:tRNA U34 2-thiouridine synthase MnmA/TrmU